MHNLTSKLPEVTTTIFTVMSQLANENDAINLSQGFPDFETDRQLIELTLKAMQGGYNQYAPMAGLIGLREILSEKTQTLYGHYYHPDSEITITAGATQAIFTIISAFIHPGDEVILLKPAYDSYEPAIELFNGTVVPIQLKVPEYTIDWEEFSNKLSNKTRMVIINTPHNPSGSVLSKEDMGMLERLLQDTNIILLSDEVYEHIIFDGLLHQSVARFPGLAERSFVVNSFGKTFHTTGWKTGYCMAPSELMKEFRKVHQFNVFSCNHAIQYALTTYLKNKEKYTTLPDFYQEKRDLFLSYLKDSRFTFISAAGTYFQLLNYAAITNERDIDFAKRLTIEHKVAAIPVSVFNHNQQDDRVLRFCFAKKEDTLKRAAEILCRL